MADEFDDLVLNPTIRSQLCNFLKAVKKTWTEEENAKREKERLHYQEKLREVYEELNRITWEYNEILKQLQQKLAEQDENTRHLSNRLAESQQKIEEQKKQLNEYHSRSAHIDETNNRVSHQRHLRRKEQEKHRDMSFSQDSDNKCEAIISPLMLSQERQSRSPTRDTMEPSLLVSPFFCCYFNVFCI